MPVVAQKGFLARTGASVGLYAAAAVALVIAGTLLTLGARRRRPLR